MKEIKPSSPDIFPFFFPKGKKGKNRWGAGWIAFLGYKQINKRRRRSTPQALADAVGGWSRARSESRNNQIHLEKGRRAERPIEPKACLASAADRCLARLPRHALGRRDGRSTTADHKRMTRGKEMSANDRTGAWRRRAAVRISFPRPSIAWQRLSTDNQERAVTRWTSSCDSSSVTSLFPGPSFLWSRS